MFHKSEFWKFIQFGLAGLPGFVLAIGLNFLLVTVFRWPKPVAYAPVIAMQTVLGFLINYYFVFHTAERRPIFLAFAQFAASMGFIRVFDWSTYTALVEFAKVPYLVAQLFCVAFFLLVKFAFAKAIFRSKSAEAESGRGRVYRD